MKYILLNSIDRLQIITLFAVQFNVVQLIAGIAVYIKSSSYIVNRVKYLHFIWLQNHAPKKFVNL